MNLFNTYPRVIGYPNRIVCKTKEDFINLYNRMNGIVNKLYIGLYQCDDNGSMENVIIDKIAFDIDAENKYEIMVELHDKLTKENIPHQVVFSTNGLWVYVVTLPTTFQKEIAKGKIASMQDYILEGTSAFFGESKSSPIDQAVRGDVQRLTRMPSSFDKIRKRYAIFLNQDDIDKGYDNIVSISTNCDKKRRFDIITFCEDGIPLDPNKFEAKKIYINNKIRELSDVEYNYSIPENLTEYNKKLFDTLPKTIQRWITDYQLCTWACRSFTILYFREKGYSPEITESLLKPFYENHKRTDEYGNHYNHMKKVKAIELLYKRRDLKFPNNITLYNLGLCSYDIIQKNGTNGSLAYR